MSKRRILQGNKKVFCGPSTSQADGQANTVVDWSTFTGDPLNGIDGSQPNDRYWQTVNNQGGYAQILNDKLNYTADDGNRNWFSTYRLKGYIPQEQTDWDVRVAFSGFVSDLPGGTDRNYGAKIQIDTLTTHAYRAMIGRSRESAYNGYVTDTNITSQVRFNASPETSGVIRLHRSGNNILASRWLVNDWKWGVSNPLTLRSDAHTIGDLEIVILFEAENNAALVSNMYNFQYINPGLVLRIY